jgi:peptide/nickel transport system substrate-binding protein
MNSQDFDLSRRRLFQAVGIGALGAAGVTGLSSCSKADSGGGVGDGEFHGAYPYEQPPDGHYNVGGAPYAPVPKFMMEGPYRDLMVLPSAYYYWHDKKWEYMLAESSELDTKANTFTVKLRKDLTWSNGDPVTSKDYMTTMWIQYIQHAASWSSIKKIEAPDDLTFVVHLKNPSAVIERYILRGNVLPTTTYGEFADQAAEVFDGDGIDGDKGKDLNKEFQEFRPEELLVTGPFNIDPDSVTDTQMTLVENKKGFGVDKVKFKKLVIYNGETPTVDPLVKEGAVDYATHGFSPAQEEAHKSAGRKIVRPPNYSGPALFINFKKLPEFDDVKVRQALAHAIDREQNGKIALADSGVGVVSMAGFSDIQVPDWMSEEDQGKLNKYEFDRDKAAELLEDAGWKKDGDTWQTKDGKAAEYEIKYPGEFADWSAAGDDVAAQLSEFGIKVTAKAVDHEQWNVEVDTGEFEFGIHQWGSSQHPHPHFSFVQDLFIHNTPVAKNQGGDGIAFDLNVDYSEGKLDMEKAINDAGSGLDESEQKANVTKVALAFNELLPIVPLFERYGNNPCQEGDGKRVLEFPDEDDPILENSAYADNPIILWIITGKLKPGA